MQYSKDNADYIEGIKKRLAKVENRQPWQLFYKGHDRYDLGPDTCVGGFDEAAPDATAWDEDTANFMVSAPQDVRWLIDNLEASECMREDAQKYLSKSIPKSDYAIQEPFIDSFTPLEAELLCEAIVSYKRVVGSKMLEKKCDEVYNLLRNKYGYFAG